MKVVYMIRPDGQPISVNAELYPKRVKELKDRGYKEATASDLKKLAKVEKKVEKKAE